MQKKDEQPIVVTLEASPLALCTERLDGTERHRALLSYDAAISLSGALLVCAQHEKLVSEGRIDASTDKAAQPTKAAPIFRTRPTAAEGSN